VLLDARAARPRPGLDDKVLAAWNGLAIHGMAKAGVRLGQAAWIESAARAADFVRTRMTEDGRLHATWKDDRVGHPGYLDDYANMLQGVLTLLGARWRDQDMMFAVFLGDELLSRFQDAEAGGFYFTAHDHERLIHRPKPTADDALPAGNGTAARALLALGHLTGEPRFVEAAEKTLAWARGLIEQHPAGHCLLLTALEESIDPPELVIVRGPQEQLEPWLAAAREGYQPTRLAYGIPYDAAELPSYLPRLVSTETRAKVSAFFCTGTQCSAPMTDFDAFKRAVS
jgi:hypothetical protein